MVHLNERTVFDVLIVLRACYEDGFWAPVWSDEYQPTLYYKNE